MDDSPANKNKNRLDRKMVDEFSNSLLAIC